MGQLQDVTWVQVNDFVDRNGSKKGLGVIEVFSDTVLTFPLASGIYELKENITISEQLTTEIGSSVFFQADGGGRTMTLDSASIDLIVGNATSGLLVMDGFNISITGASSTLFNQTGMLFGADKLNCLFTASNTQSIGSIVNSPLSISFEGCIFDAWANGLSVDNQATRTFIDRCQFSSDKTGTGSAITIGANCPRSEVFESFFDLANGESLFNINSGFTGNAVIQNYTKVNPNSTSYAVGGLDNTSIYVRNDQSRAIGSYHVTSNSTATVIALINTWYDLNLNASAVASSNIERFTLTDATTGELTYIGLEDFSGDLFASVGGFSVGGSQVFELRAIKNGSPLSDNIVSPRETGGDVGSQSLLTPITCVTGDTIKIQVQNTDGTSNFTVRDISVTIR